MPMVGSNKNVDAICNVTFEILIVVKQPPPSCFFHVSRKQDTLPCILKSVNVA